jgi:plastocyanin
VAQGKPVSVIETRCLRLRGLTIKHETITNDAYNPATLPIKHETTVVWVNRDTKTHTVTADNGSFDSGPIAPGKTYAHTFLTEGVSVAYHSSLHAFMHGVVNVVHG